MKSNWVSLTNLSQLSESSGGGLWAKGFESWNNHLKSFNSLFGLSRSNQKGGSISGSIGSHLSLMSSN